MPAITPQAYLNVAYLHEAHGLVLSPSDNLSWDIPSLLGSPAIYADGWTLDPTGNYAIQTPVLKWLDTDETTWTYTGAFGRAMSERTGKTLLRHTASTGPFDATRKALRARDKGFSVSLRRFAAPAQAGQSAPPSSLRVEFSAGAAKADYVLSLLLDDDKPVQLQGRYAGAAWTTLDTAFSLGELDSYLESNGRHLTIDVVPLTNADYWNYVYENGPNSWRGDPPPDTVLVVLNGGDAILQYKAPGLYLAGGKLRVSGSGGQFGLEYAGRNYAPNATMNLNPKLGRRPFKTDPHPGIRGHLPYPGSFKIEATITDTARAACTVTTTSPVLGQTAMLSTVFLDFPAVFLGPQIAPRYTSFPVVEWLGNATFNQGQFLGRKSYTAILEDNRGNLTPAGVIPAVRAASLSHGWRLPDGADNIEHVMSGLMAIDAREGIRWFFRGYQKFVQISISDKLRRGEPDQVCVTFMPPLDGQCHYYAMRILAHKIGITDDFLNFPICDRNSNCPHYHLPQGTVSEPLMQLPPQMPVLTAMLLVRSLAGEADPYTGRILPFYLYPNHIGGIEYYPMPVGVARTFLSEQGVYVEPLTPFQTYEGVPRLSDANTPNLNEFVAGDNWSSASLANIRPQVILEGLNPRSGELILGQSYNEALGGGLHANPDATGYVGLDIPYININRLFNSPEAVAQNLELTAIQTAFPAIRCLFTAHLQSALQPLMPIAVSNSFLTGTYAPVSFYVTGVQSRGGTRQGKGGMERYGQSVVQARLLGQAD